MLLYSVQYVHMYVRSTSTSALSTVRGMAASNTYLIAMLRCAQGGILQRSASWNCVRAHLKGQNRPLSFWKWTVDAFSNFSLCKCGPCSAGSGVLQMRSEAGLDRSYVVGVLHFCIGPLSAISLSPWHRLRWEWSSLGQRGKTKERGDRVVTNVSIWSTQIEY